ncbi:multidrug effflux MFS transporter [Candidatus Sororendozoicomonas aggregata]|uniref:multidrug effflux MFS transporter n=1 Tax=Candidatus Sororendozoicomonas aggregata TaxID=3073239 RepID=UPI002ED5AA5C
MKQLIPEQHAPLVLVMLTLFAVIGPVSIDIFTPSLPAITEYFHTTSATSQWSVGLFMVGFSVSMLICGPLADRYGRKKTLLGGYLIFLLATFIALTTEHIHVFIAARFFQAVFGCFGTAIARTIARDYYRDKNQVRILAYIAGCLTIAPMAAPVAGGFIQEYAGWHMNFLTMAALALMAIAVLPLLPEKYQPVTPKQRTSPLSAYREVLTNRHYLRYCFASGTAFSGAFVFVTGGAFVFIGALSLSPTQYGLLFAIAIASFMVSTLYAPKLSKQLGYDNCLKLSALLLLTGAGISLVSGYFSQGESVAGYITGISVYELGLGVYLPICQARATESMKDNIGTASGLLFFVEMVLASIISGLVSALPEAGTTSLAMVTFIISVLSLMSLCLKKASNLPKNTCTSA